MNALDELKIHADALAELVDENPKFFASIKHYVRQLKDATRQYRGKVGQSEFQLLAGKIENFFSQYRHDNSDSDFIYFPPAETANSDSTVKEINGLVNELAAMDEKSFNTLFPPENPSQSSASIPDNQSTSMPCVFLGHGRSRLWARLKMFLEDELHLATVTYESESRVGESIIPILEKMLNQASFAVLVLTAEDETGEGNKRARQNVVHEAGLFQGRLGFRKAIVLQQQGLEGFTNVDGLQCIPFADDNIEQTFYELQRVLKREGLGT
jgi:hypothetical protein